MGDLTYPYQSLDGQTQTVKNIFDGNNEISKEIINAKKPLIILGESLLNSNSSNYLFNTIKGFLGKNNKISDTWNSLNILSTDAATVGNFDLGILKKENDIGTIISNKNSAVKSKKQWIANSLKAKGKLYVDFGAKKVIKKSGKSLLPIGIRSIEGSFQKGDMLIICSSDKIEIARGLSNYDSKQLKSIIGKSTSQIKKEFGVFDSELVIHRDNMILS